MEIVVVGLDYKKAPVGIREKAAFDTNAKKHKWARYLLDQGHREVLILSTCNRSEIYMVSKQPKKAVEDARNAFASIFGGQEIDSYLNVWQEREGIMHLYQVASGFDSMVLGEDQILGQVKQALEFGMEYKHSGKFLNKLFREGVTFSKKIRHHYGFSETPISTCYTGIQLLRQSGNGLEGKKVLITGAGNMGTLALRHVLSEKPEKVLMTNRRHDNLMATLLEYQQVIPVRYDDRFDALDEADVLISATASPHVVYTADRVKIRKKPLSVLDLAIPRDVDLELRHRDRISLFDIDDLRKVVDGNMEKRRQIVEQCKEDLRKEVEGYIHWKKVSRLDPLLDYVSEKCEGIQRETIGYLEKNTELTPDQLEEIGRLLMGHLKQSFKKPIIRMKKPDGKLQQSDLEVFMEGLSKRHGG